VPGLTEWRAAIEVWVGLCGVCVLGSCYRTEWARMTEADSKSRVQRYLQGIAAYLTVYRKREGFTQNEMARKLNISLNRYREYEQNTTDNAKGIPLDLLLRVCELEGVTPQSFVAQLEGASGGASTPAGKLDEFEERLLAEFRNVPVAERRKFVESFEYDDETDKLIPNQMRWFVRIFNQLVRLPYGQRMKIEREVLEAYLAHSDVDVNSEEYNAHLTRLRTLLRYYFSNFGDVPLE
jgi:transcriptional regulator with XRE-family HTH domain